MKNRKNHSPFDVASKIMKSIIFLEVKFENLSSFVILIIDIQNV